MNFSYKILIVFYLFIYIYPLSASESILHKHSFVKSINNNHFSEALEEFPLVEDWTFNTYNEDDFLLIDNTISFIEYILSNPSYKQLCDSLQLYLVEECSYFVDVYKKELDYSNVISVYKFILTLQGSVYGENNLEYAETLDDLGCSYFFIGAYSKAEEYFLQLLEIKKNLLGENNLDYANSLGRLAALYNTVGDYISTKEYLLKALSIKKNIVGEKHIDYASSLNDLGALYSELGDYFKAAECFEQSLSIFLRNNHSDSAMCLNNLANLYLTNGDYLNAEKYLLQSAEITQNEGDSYSYVLSLNN